MKKKLLSILVILCMILSLAACGSAPKAEPDENGNYVVNGSFEEADFTLIGMPRNWAIWMLRMEKLPLA